MTTVRPGAHPPTTRSAPPNPVALRFGERLRSALQFGPRAVDELVRSYDPDLADHHRRVAHVAVAIGRSIGLSGDTLTGIGLASSIHDIGEIGAPGTPDTCPATGRAFSSEHPHAGATIIDGIRFPWPLRTMILQHHEHADGSGFPNGLRRDETLLASRIITVADAVVLVSDRRPPSLQASDQLLCGRGSVYDPDVVDACLAVYAHVLRWDGPAPPRVP